MTNAAADGAASSAESIAGSAVTTTVTPSTSTNCTRQSTPSAVRSRLKISPFFIVEVRRYPAMRRGTQRRVTLRDVGDELGVSAKTVSNAFRRPDQLSARLREQILAVAERLGYPGPDPLAASLRRGRVGAIGFAYANRLTYAFADPVAVELLAGITEVAEAAGAGLLLVPGSASTDSKTTALSAALIDGLIVNSLADDDPLLTTAIARRLALVVIDQPDPGRLAQLGAPDTPWVGVDDRAAAVTLAEQLLTLGHRHLGVVCFGLHRRPERGLVGERSQRHATYAVSRRRLAGFRDAAVRAGLDWSRVPVHQGADSTVAEGEIGAEAVLSTTPRPTALLCLSDRLAEGALNTAARLGLRVPEDLSVVGFDDATQAAQLGLTTIRQPTRRKGTLATEALLELLAGHTPHRRRQLPAKLIVRTSTDSPRPPSR